MLCYLKIISNVMFFAYKSFTCPNLSTSQLFLKYSDTNNPTGIILFSKVYCQNQNKIRFSFHSHIFFCNHMSLFSLYFLPLLSFITIAKTKNLVSMDKDIIIIKINLKNSNKNYLIK